VIDNDIYRSFYAKELLRPAVSVYYRRDNLQPFPYWSKHVGRLEPLLIGKSDLVVCNSSAYRDYAAQFNPNSHVVGQGVDLKAYDPGTTHTVPEILGRIPRPLVGYVGDITSMRLDPDLVEALAKGMPHCSFAMIGPEDRVFREHPMHRLPNLHFTGIIPKSEVPAHMAALQVCLNPQKVNEITHGNYPRKVDEYLAMGKPVVATRTKTMEMFRDHVSLCDTVDEYVAAIDAALDPPSEDVTRARINFARSHSWEENVARIYGHLEKLIK
jgi:glycosyltransferase involved in cell wall biosynthesis